MGPGATGPDVKKWQEALNKAGFPVPVDGVFGAKTEEATKLYQAQLGVSVDGVVGQETSDAYNVSAGTTSRQLDTVYITARNYLPYILGAAVVIGGIWYLNSRRKKKKK